MYFEEGLNMKRDIVPEKIKKPQQETTQTLSDREENTLQLRPIKLQAI